ncbi:Bgt-4801 [Blumeria graminis f. sp. tritici]|uniref:Folic acid synthesis protein FOL1 n=2 Tax=Blumeria graminis f. sp. tritici TaxID=62690 RepID=A0A381LIR4_BLUGR|nr:Bgt-4801 [Blumeria graminis f. sp. tritici]
MRHLFGLTSRPSQAPITKYYLCLSIRKQEWRRSFTNVTKLSFSLKLPCLEKASIQNTIRSLSKHVAYIALGSNLGDRVEWIEKACIEMSNRGIDVKRTSSLWETKPMYITDQANFLNGVCEVETTLQPIELLDQLQTIEKELGRKKIIDKGPRNIDLDILLYADDVIDHCRLKVPHLGIYEREFVLRPLSELISQRILANSRGKTVKDYLEALPTSEMSTITPLALGQELIHSMRSDRQTQMMAIVNLTPDSFSGDKQGNDLIKRKEFLADTISCGACIMDFGGQSSKPFAANVSCDEEITRVIPAITWAHNERHKHKARPFAISVDTYRADVAEAAVKAGADIINDVSGGTLDARMLPTVARLGKTVCLTHMRGTPSSMNRLTNYPAGLIPTIASELLERISAAEAAGVRRWRIILDPGIGFAKTVEQNLDILRGLNELRNWPGLRGFPWLVGTSRKGFIGKITGVEVPRERTWGTAATVAAAIAGGADIVRVHDVKEMMPVVRMSNAIWRT